MKNVQSIALHYYDRSGNETADLDALARVELVALLKCDVLATENNDVVSAQVLLRNRQ